MDSSGTLLAPFVLGTMGLLFSNNGSIVSLIRLLFFCDNNLWNAWNVLRKVT